MVGLQEETLLPGQFIFGRKKAAQELMYSENKTYRLINKLKNMQNIDIKSNNKYSIITIVNWELYQGLNGVCEQQSEQQIDNKQTTNRQQIDTNKNVKNDKKLLRVINPAPISEKHDIETIISLYKEKLSHLPQPQKITDARKKHINARLVEFGLEEVIRGLDKASKSQFLAGNNSREWKADIDWIFKPDNFAKILEGKYDNKEQKQEPENWRGSEVRL